jgi:DNA-binding CsgD family transcriptional regulator
MNALASGRDRGTFHSDIADAVDCEVIAQALEALGLAAFVCADGPRVAAFTSRAQAALAAGRLQIRAGRLTTGSRFDPTGLARAVAAVGSPGPARPQAITVVSRDTCDPAAAQVLDVVAVPRGGRETRSYIIVLLRGGTPSGRGLELILSRAFGLTPAEAQVATLLATGKPRKSIAADRGVSLQTLRAQVRSIFEKMNVTRERELMHVLAKMTSR